MSGKWSPSLQVVPTNSYHYYYYYCYCYISTVAFQGWIIFLWLCCQALCALICFLIRFFFFLFLYASFSSFPGVKGSQKECSVNQDAKKIKGCFQAKQHWVTEILTERCDILTMFTQIFEGLQCARHASRPYRYTGEQDWKSFCPSTSGGRQ